MRWSAVVLAFAMALLAAGCGGGSEPEARDGGGGPEPTVDTVCNAAIVAASAAAQQGFLGDEVEVPAGRPFTICFSNNDEGVPHSVAIAMEHGGDTIFSGETITGPETIVYDVSALDAGTYHFHCEVHPDTMTGILSVG